MKECTKEEVELDYIIILFILMLIASYKLHTRFLLGNTKNVLGVDETNDDVSLPTGDSFASM
jgi:hypothetical protein